MANHYGILIIYGSETGNAQDYAFQIYKIIKSSNLKVKICDGDNFDDYQLLPLFNLLIFVVSTSGQGSEPKNLKKIWKYLLQSSLPKGIWLQNVFSAVLGLGDSNYKRFNFCAKRLYRRLENLGSQMAIPLGLANEQEQYGIDTVAVPWISEIIEFICKTYNVHLSKTPSYNMTSFFTEHDCSHNPCICAYKNLTSEQFKVKANEILTSREHFQEINLISFKSYKVFKPGDTLEIYPQNTSELVNSVLGLFHHLDSNKLVDIKSRLNHFIPIFGVNFLWLCEWYFDFNAVPRRDFFRILSKITNDSIESERLLELSLPENIDDYQTYCTRPHRNYYETFRDFPKSVRCINLLHLFDLVPKMRIREYSICSPPSNFSSIVVARVKYQTVIREPRRGLCSTFLCSLKLNDSVFANFKEGSLVFPPNDTQCIFIGTGTGCAVFRSFLLSLKDKPQTVPHLLFLGFRNIEKDFLFCDDWTLLESNKRVKMFTAFSRDQHHKIYVQHRIKEQASLVWNSINQGAWVFVCGNSKRMPDEVREAILTVFITNGNLSNHSASTYLANLEKSGRYQTETY